MQLPLPSGHIWLASGIWGARLTARRPSSADLRFLAPLPFSSGCSEEPAFSRRRPNEKSAFAPSVDILFAETGVACARSAAPRSDCAKWELQMHRKSSSRFTIANAAQIIAYWLLILILRRRVYPDRLEPIIFATMAAICLFVLVNRIRRSQWATGGHSPILFFALVIGSVCIIVLLPFTIAKIAGW